MGKLADWCAEQPDWASDGLRRVANSAEIEEADIDALASRVALAHQLPVEGDHPCVAFNEADLGDPKAVDDGVLLCSVGPLEGIDRLLGGQELQFALDGVTVIFGDNGSGKSGYARALRRLCQARVPVALQGNVFADGPAVERRITYKYKKGEADPITEVWTEGDAPPAALAGITMIDTENARVYVAGDNEILFLPPEIGCLTRLGKLYTAVSERFQGQADGLNRNLQGAYGELYSADTTAGALVKRLTTVTPRNQIPTAQQLRDAAIWNDELAAELGKLEAELAQSPAAISAKLLRITGVLDTFTLYFRGLESSLDANAVRRNNEIVQAKKRTKATADALAAEQIGGQPIAATGSDSWKTLFGYAREFAAEAQLRQPGEAFEAGDPCPLCQQPLDESSAQRLAAFDQFVEGKANSDAKEANDALIARIAELEALPFRPIEELRQAMEEFSAQGEGDAALATAAVQWSETLENRRNALLKALRAEEDADTGDLAGSPLDRLLATAEQIKARQQELAAGAGPDAVLVARANELRDQKTLHSQLGEVITRRDNLDRRLGLGECITSLNTAPVSRLATNIRKELVTPELSKRIKAELDGFDLGYIPLEFREASRQGTSFFQMALATDGRVDKAKVLSEGEQRALSLACFLADSHISGRKSAIIFDDPVTSLDHQRMRRVARRLAQEAATGRQIIVFTHNVLFYQELFRACADAHPQIPALPCLVQQAADGSFGLVSVNDEPWIAKKVKEREHRLADMIKAIPDNLARDGDEYRTLCTSFYAALRETWERLVEEVLLNEVVQRFGTDVGTLRLRGVEVTPEDYRIIFFAMKRVSEFSGHDRAAARQIDVPDKAQMEKDRLELVAYRATITKRRKELEEQRKALEEPPRANVA